jgi:restriction endonuclease S subunit
MMNMNQAPFVQQIERYGNDDAYAGIEELFSSCCAYQKGGIVLEDVIADGDMQACFSRLVSSIQFNTERSREWKFLCFLLKDSNYSGATRMLAVFSESNACLSLLVYCGTVH